MSNDLKYPDGCWLEAIFRRQQEMFEKYHNIEMQQGFHLLVSFPINLNSKFAQHMLKDYAWRFTEELAEALGCLKVYEFQGDWTKAPELPDYLEELIDALHFLTELTLLCGLGPAEVTRGFEEDRLALLLGPETGACKVPDLYEQAAKTIVALGASCNYLKNKPWKQTPVLTDETSFKAQLVEVWWEFFRLLRLSGLTPKDVYDYYFRKSEVNRFRQGSNY